MKSLMERTQGFAQKKPAPVKRGGASYDATYRWAHRKLTAAVEEYRALPSEDQTARLTRDEMEFVLRRYQNYCIKENIGAHYYEVGLAHDAKTEFEHVIPAVVARESKHKTLNKTKLGSTTPDVYWFWQRYQDLGIKIETHDGTEVDTQTWNLDNHYNYFNK
jgi:hypothetical protein